ncbi:MAG: hypothetical protein OES13_10460 [Acidimicrobiia bacterium]|nr:hypothetical protein [Acidimicrobiia bacterium]
MFSQSDPITWRRKWTVVAGGTLITMASMWSLVVAVAAAGSDSADAPEAAPFAAFGLALVPLVFVTVAFGSKNLRAAGMTLAAMGLFLIVSLPIGLLDSTTGLVAAFGIGGAFALRAELEHRRRGRVLAVVLVALYTLVVISVVPALGIAVAPLLPLPAVAVADVFMEYRAENDPRSTLDD